MERILARKVTRADFKQFDYIVAMDHGHLNELQTMGIAGDKAVLSLLLDHHPDHAGKDVPDPYYGGRSDFEYTYSLINDGIEAFIEDILAEIGEKSPLGAALIHNT